MYDLNHKAEKMLTLHKNQQHIILTVLL